jgi:AraC-like DNA-binding protein
MLGDSNKRLIEQLSRSQIYQDYERAFGQATGLPLSLRAPEVWQPVQHGKKNENPFCAILARHSRTCAACLELQQKIAQAGQTGPRTERCFAGLCDTAMPIHVGSDIIGYLQTGQVLLSKPSEKQFARTAKRIVEWGIKVDLKELEEAYFHTRVLSPKQYDSLVQLLTIFGQHLSIVCNQIAVQQQNSEPPAIARAKEFIKAHQSEEISLSDVARAVNSSTFYFCKMFKKSTGLNFTDYLSRIRIEKAKSLLLNPNLRVSEVAFEVGFQSLTHFNRVFRKIAGQSPTEYRESLHKS